MVEFSYFCSDFWPEHQMLRSQYRKQNISGSFCPCQPVQWLQCEATADARL